MKNTTDQLKEIAIHLNYTARKSDGYFINQTKLWNGLKRLSNEIYINKNDVYFMPYGYKPEIRFWKETWTGRTGLYI